MLNSLTWIDFFEMLAQVAVALLALLFVTFQITREKWISKHTRKLIAIQTLLEFLVPSFFAMIALLPIDPIQLGKFQLSIWQIGGILFSLVGLIMSYKIIRYGNNNRESLGSFFKKQKGYQKYAIIEYLFILIFSVLNMLAWTSIMLIWLLLSGSIETWMFFAELDQKECESSISNN